MKVEPVESFLDDAPVSEADWNTVHNWREQPTKFTGAETAKLAIIGLCMFVLALAGLVVAFCYF